MPNLFHQFVFLFTIFIHQISSQDSFDCTGYEDDSFHPIFDGDDCRHYWHCIYVNTVYMHAVKRICPAGTQFDIRLRQCETSSEVDCRPVQSPHGPRTTSTTRAWKMIYSKLFSRIQVKPTMPYLFATRQHSMFNFDEPIEIETTTANKQIVQVTQPNLSFEQLSKRLHALIANRQKQRTHLLPARFVQPGEPENEAEMYTPSSSTTKRRARRTRSTTQSTTELPFTTEPIITTTATTTTTTITTTIIDTTVLTSSIVRTQTSTIQSRIIWSNGESRRRRQNMTLYILTSDDHKIRQFPVNHTRGILINCNQLRRRLLGRRRRTRDISPITSSATLHSSFIHLNQSSKVQLNFNLFILSIIMILNT